MTAQQAPSGFISRHSCRLFADQMADPAHPHHFRTSHHPLWSIVMFPLVNGVRAVAGASLESAIPPGSEVYILTAMSGG